VGRGYVKISDSHNRQASLYGLGGGDAMTSTGTAFFAGRSAGGGTRQQVFGTQQYGSG